MTVWGYVWLTAVCWIAADVLLVGWWVRMVRPRR